MTSAATRPVLLYQTNNLGTDLGIFFSWPSFWKNAKRNYAFKIVRGAFAVDIHSFVYRTRLFLKFFQYPQLCDIHNYYALKWTQTCEMRELNLNNLIKLVVILKLLWLGEYWQLRLYFNPSESYQSYEINRRFIFVMPMLALCFAVLQDVKNVIT